ncbi:MAG: hypothetical protein P8Y42_13390 [Exilibacterium sp.]
MGDKKALVPRLRFPEFRDAGEWEVKKAKFLFSNRVGYNIMRMWQGASGVAKSITHGKEGEYAVKAAGRT